MSSSLSPMTSTKRYTVLLIDDSPEDRVTYRRYLQRDPLQTYDILEADSAAIGLDICQNSLPDVILIDYLLPDMDGIALLKVLAQPDRNLNIPIVMLTGQGNEAVATQAMKSGAQDYLVKGSLTADLLCKTVNYVIEQFQSQQAFRRQQQQQQIVAEMTLRIRQSLALQEILQTTVDEVRQFLKNDRVIIFRFLPNWHGVVAVESCAEEWTAILSTEIYDPCFGENYVEPFKQGLFTAKSDIYTAGIDQCHLDLLSNFQVRANLVVPIIQNNELWGLLIAHHCVAPRQWQDSEIGLLRQLAAQVGIALQQAALFEQVQTELVERQQAEAALQERESLLRLFAQSAPAGIAMFDREMRYVMASQRWVDEYNLSSVESLIGRSHYDVFPDIPERWRHSYQRCLDGAIEKCDDDLFVRSNGTQQWISWEIRPWYTQTGEIGGIVIFSSDNTSRKRAEIELRDRERLFSTLAEALPVVIFRFDQNSHCTYINNYWTELTGRTTESVAGLGWVETLHPEDRDRLTNEWLEWSQNPQQRGLYQNEGRLVHASGQDIWCYIQALPELDTNGEIIGYIGVFTNVTDLKQAEEALRQSEARLRLAQSASNSAVWDWDVRANTLFWSPEYYQLYGLDPTLEPTYEGWLGCIYPDDREKASQQTLQALEESSDLRVEFRVMRSDGIRWFAGIGQVLRDEAEQPIRMIGIAIDITQQKQTEIALQQFNAELEERVIERTHELKTVNDRLLETLIEQQHTQLLLLEQAQLLDLAHDTIMTLDLNWVITFWNQGAEKMYGWSKNEALGKESYILLKTQFPHPLDEIQAAVFDQGYWEGELVHFNRDNHPLIVASRWVLQKDPMGRPIKILEINNDITARKQAELALQESEERRRLALDLTHIGFWDMQLPNGSIIWNDNHFTLLGLTPYECEPSYELWRDHIHPDDLEWVEPLLMTSIEQHMDYAAEYRVVHSDGTVRWLMGRARALYDDAAQPIRSIGVLLDVTDRKQAEQMLALQAVITRNMAEGICLIKAEDASIVYANPKFEQMFGYDPGELNGQPVTILNYPSESVTAEDVYQSIRAAVLQNHEFTYEVHNIKKDRTPFWCSATCSVFQHPEHGDVLVAVQQDITERRKIDQMKQDFISIVSHELRTPLTSIRGSLGLIAGGVYDKKPEKMKEMIEIAARQSDRLVRLVNDILNLRRLESGQAKFNFQQCSAADLIQQSVDVMRSQAEQSQVTLDILPTTVEVWADADAIVQTLTNLLSNAIKFSPCDSTITVTATPYPSTSSLHSLTCFSVQDQGRGIPSNQLETIFGQFQQVDASDSREKGGTGLGLAICRTIVKQHGGRIWVESQLEQGSTFYFTLPSTQPLPDND